MTETEQRTVDLSDSPRPTQTDAQLLLQLAQLGATETIDRGQTVLRSRRGDGGLTYEQYRALGDDSAEAAGVRAVLKWHETVGTLVKQGLLNRQLVNDWIWAAGTWALVKDVALGMRAETGEPSLWENFEALAGG